MGTSAPERWLGTPPKFVGMRGHGHCETSFSSWWSKDWTQKQAHRFQIKRKINEIVFYHFHWTYQQCSWQYGNGNTWFTVQRWPKRKYKNSRLLDLYSKHTDTNTFSAVHSYAVKWFASLEFSTNASGFLKHEECWMQNKGPRQRTLIWKTDCEFLPGRLKLMWTDNEK